jgi:hypothetical protein
LLEQREATPEMLVSIVSELMTDTGARERARTALRRWHHPDAACRIAEEILAVIGRHAISRTRERPDAVSAAVPRNSAAKPVERHDFSAA